MSNKALTDQKKKEGFGAIIRRYWMFYLMILPSLVLCVMFQYINMPNHLIAFKKYNPYDGIFGSPWADQGGLANFIKFLTVPRLTVGIWNTFRVNFLNFVFGFPAPIILALLFNELRNKAFRYGVQAISYLPAQLSGVVVIGLIHNFYATDGMLNDFRVWLFGPETERILFLAIQGLLIPNLIIIPLWQSVGMSSIMYTAMLAGIDQQMYEAAVVEGAGKIKQITKITLPHLAPYVTMGFIFGVSGWFTGGFGYLYQLTNAFVSLDTTDMIMLKQGLQAGDYSFTAAVGLLMTMINFVMLFGTNAIVKKLGGYAFI